MSWARSDLAFRLTTLPLRNSVVEIATHQMGFHISPITPMPSTDLHSPVATAQLVLHPRCWAELWTVPLVLTAWKWRLKDAKVKKKYNTKEVRLLRLPAFLKVAFRAYLFSGSHLPWLGRFWRSAVMCCWDRKEARESVHLGESWLQGPSPGLAAGLVVFHGFGLCPLSLNCSPVTPVGTGELILGLGSLPLLCAGYCGQGHGLGIFQKLRLLVVNMHDRGWKL